MPIAMTCDECGKTSSVPDAFAGKRGRCKGCGAVAVVPGLPTLPAAATRIIEVESWPAPAASAPPQPGAWIVPAPAPHPAPARVQSHSPPAPTAAPSTVPCAFCGEPILPAAKKCKHCGEFLDAVLRATLAAPAVAAPAPQFVVHNTNTAASHASVHVRGKRGFSILSCFVKLILIFFLLGLVGTLFRPRVPSVATPTQGVRPPAAAPPSPSPDAPSPPTARPEDDWPPLVGTAVIVERPGAAGHAHLSADMATARRLRRSIEAGTLGDFTRMREAGLIEIVPNGAEAVVIGSADGARQVRITSGIRAGSTGWVFMEHLHEQAPSPGRKPRPTLAAKPIDPAARAATLLRSAENTAKNGNAKGAAELYREVVAKYPDAPQAKDAAARIEAMESK